MALDTWSPQKSATFAIQSAIRAKSQLNEDKIDIRVFRALSKLITSQVQKMYDDRLQTDSTMARIRDTRPLCSSPSLSGRFSPSFL